MSETMKVTATGWRVTIPAGTYFLGDPCYAVPNDAWTDLLRTCGYFGASDDPEDGTPGPVGTFVHNGGTVQVLAFSTAYGDGEYVDQYGKSYSVDAGLIGLTPVLDAPGWDADELDDLGRVVTFDEDVIATTDGEGRLSFGRFTIDTNDGGGYDDDYQPSSWW